MHANVQRWCTWSAAGFALLFFIGWWPMAGLMPPPSPSLSPTAIAHFYGTDTNMIRAGLLVAMVGIALQFPFFTAIFYQMRRIEGPTSPLAYIQILTGTVGVFIFFTPMMLMEAAAFRPDRNPSVTQGLNDAAWIPFLGTFMLAVLQLAVIAVAIFRDKRAEPVYPRWVAYFNIWVACGFPLASLNVFVKHGPLSWPGIFTFWIPATVYFAWFTVMLIMTLRAINQQERELAEQPKVAREAIAV
ncbi:MAG: hypothetical protein ACYDHH_27085 [Solirubrobacteraceae bacterium]